MRGKWIVLGSILGFAVAFTIGSAFAASRDGGIDPPTRQDGLEWMDQMHGSQAMQQMREQMGPELAAQCDQMHAQMREQMQEHMGTFHGSMGGGRMDGTGMGSGMMDGSGMMGS